MSTSGAAHVAAGAVEVRRLGYHLKAFLGAENLPKPTTNDRVIVGDYYSNHAE
ncbi:MAG: hypothetical protein M3Y09_05780 [Actinomycetota bacterium]|nr:hypothetical protein [Actinomycetota bacterium]